MRESKGVFNTLVLTSVVVVLSACGGGGGGSNGGSSTSVITASAPVTITSANAPAVTGAALDASDDLTGSGGGVSGLVAASVGDSRTADINVIDALVAQVRRAPGLLGSGASGVGPAAVAQINNEPCDTGTFSGSFNDADNSQDLSTGDTLTLTLNSCSFDGVAMNGSMTLDNLVVTGGFNSTPSVAPYSFSFRIQTSSLSITEAGETVVMSGGATISESTNDDVTFTSSFSGSAIRITASGETLTLTDFSIDEIEDGSTFPAKYTLSINGTISSSSVGGSVTVTTTVAFTGVGDLDPTGGQATCVGAGGTSVSLTANADGRTVQLQVDTDGDGISDDTIDETWVNL